MPLSPLPPRALGAALVLLSAGGCGLVDDSIQGRSPASWCEEEGVGDVAQVDITQLATDDGPVDLKVVLLDADGYALADIQPPTEYGTALRRVYTRDAAGNVLEETTDWEMDGILDSVITNTYDEEGRPATTSRDEDGDGVVDQIETWDYSSALETKHFTDRNVDGEPDSIETITYSDSGELMRQEDDTDADGSPEYIQTYVRSESGLLLEYSHVLVGGWSTSTTSEYDDQDRLVRTVEIADDREFDSAIEVAYTYDDEGRQATTVRTDLLDSSTIGDTYTYDEAGRIATVTTRWNSDPDSDQTQSFIYDDEGRLVLDETRDFHGTLLWAHEYEYADGPEPIRHDQDFDGDGAWDLRRVRTACD